MPITKSMFSSSFMYNTERMTHQKFINETTCSNESYKMVSTPPL